jgi:hypothetical protein
MKHEEYKEGKAAILAFEDKFGKVVSQKNTKHGEHEELINK